MRLSTVFKLEFNSRKKRFGPFDSFCYRKMLGILFSLVLLCYFCLLEDKTFAQVIGQPGVGQNFTSGLGYRLKPMKRLRQDDGNGHFLRRTANEVYDSVSKIETRLYGKNYREESLKKRFRRIEKTLFGTPKKGDLEERLLVIERDLKLSKRPNAQYDHHKPMINYLEKKIFQRTFSDSPIPERLSQLESHVFGKSFYSYPVDVRVKKLTYTIPILAKEIRLSNEGAVLASSQSNAPKIAKDPSFSQPSLEMKGTRAPKTTASKIPGKSLAFENQLPTYSKPKSIRETPSGQAILTGDYLENIHRTSQSQFLRWMNLPIHLYIQNASQKELTLTQEAIKWWGHHFPIKIVESPYEADIFIEWNRKPASRTPITRPILHLDNQKSIRTVILIDMTPYKELPNIPVGASEDSLLRHGILHQLGHGFGLWGHSDNFHDIMYPVNGLESYDIPKRWNRRSSRQSDLATRRQSFLNALKPSPRDINTLTRLYQKTGKSLKSYSPYH